MIKFQPFGHNVLLAMPIINEKTVGGIIKSKSQIEEEVRNLSGYLTVVAIGELVTNIQVGDIVLIVQGKHNSITIDDSAYLMVYSSQIIGKKL